MPCFYTRDGADVLLIVDREPDGTLLAFDGNSASWKKIEPTGQMAGHFLSGTKSVKGETLEKERPGCFR